MQTNPMITANSATHHARQELQEFLSDNATAAEVPGAVAGRSSKRPRYPETGTHTKPHPKAAAAIDAILDARVDERGEMKIGQEYAFRVYGSQENSLVASLKSIGTLAFPPYVAVPQRENCLVAAELSIVRA